MNIANLMNLSNMLPLLTELVVGILLCLLLAGCAQDHVTLKVTCHNTVIDAKTPVFQHKNCLVFFDDRDKVKEFCDETCGIQGDK